MDYGLLWTDIVNSFSQAISADFAVGGVDGQQIIEAEIAFQAHKLESSLPADALQMLQSVNGETVIVNATGGFSPSLYASSSNIRGYVVDVGYFPCPNQNFESNSTCWQNNGQEQAVTTANISGLGNNQYVLLDAFDVKDQKLVLYYDVDQDNLSVNSLKSVLRDMVCCSLGSRIYPAADADAWSITKHYCEQADKWIESFEAGMLPSELKRMKMQSGIRGISSIRVVRS